MISAKDQLLCHLDRSGAIYVPESLRDLDLLAGVLTDGLVTFTIRLPESGDDAIYVPLLSVSELERVQWHEKLIGRLTDRGWIESRAAEKRIRDAQPLALSDAEAWRKRAPLNAFVFARMAGACEPTRDRYLTGAEIGRACRNERGEDAGPSNRSHTYEALQK